MCNWKTKKTKGDIKDVTKKFRLWTGNQNKSYEGKNISGSAFQTLLNRLVALHKANCYDAYYGIRRVNDNKRRVQCKVYNHNTRKTFHVTMSDTFTTYAKTHTAVDIWVGNQVVNGVDRVNAFG